MWSFSYKKQSIQKINTCKKEITTSKIIKIEVKTNLIKTIARVPKLKLNEKKEFNRPLPERRSLKYIIFLNILNLAPLIKLMMIPPIIVFIHNRIVKVRGRIKEVTISKTKRIGTKGVGQFKGIACCMNLKGCQQALETTRALQVINAKKEENLKWAQTL